MTANELVLGGVYQTTWDERPYRIIGFDEFSVFYDCQIDYPNWVFASNLKRKCNFYKAPTKLFAERATYKDCLPLSENEFQIIRPDLQIAFGRFNNLTWKSLSYENIDSIKSVTVKASELVLVPIGKKGGFKKGVKVVSKNNSFFESREIILAAKEIQLSISNELDNGIGLHRLGIDKGLPSYYIGEYIDRAKNLT